jgi:hypothetical protein
MMCCVLCDKNWGDLEQLKGREEMSGEQNFYPTSEVSKYLLIPRANVSYSYRT